MRGRCESGHDTCAVDVCDVCGAAVLPTSRTSVMSWRRSAAGDPADLAAVTTVLSSPSEAATVALPPLDPPPGGPQLNACPTCGVRGAPTSRYCENCGDDLSVPAGLWVAEIWVDPAWYEGQQTTHRCPPPGPPTTVRLGVSAMIGRRSASRGTHPDIDCSSDPGVSRRHAQLVSDGRRWYVEDLGSSNGSFMGRACGPLPEVPIARGGRVSIGEGDRLYVGAWTRIVVRSVPADRRAVTG